MEIVLQSVLLALVLAFLAVIINFLRKGTLTLKYSLIWIAACIALIVFLLIPVVPEKLAALMGIEVASNFVFLLEGIFVLIILISLTLIVSKQNSRIVRLIQATAILEKRIRQLENKQEGNLTDFEY